MTRQCSIGLRLALALAAPAGLAQTDHQDNAGVRVGRCRAAQPGVRRTDRDPVHQQYDGMKSQARQQGALVPDNHPQLLRLRKIAARLIPFVRAGTRVPRNGSGKST